MPKKTTTKKSKAPGPRSGTTHEKEVPEHSKDKLLKAAFDVFARKGFHGATTKAISVEAGVNEALIMRHFQSKQGLFLAVIEQCFRAKNEEELNYPPQKTLVDELREFSKQFFDRHKQNSNLLRILISQGLTDLEFASELRARIQPPHSKFFHDRLLRLQKLKVLSPKADLVAIQQFVGHISFMAFFVSNLLKLKDEKVARQEIKKMLEVYATGVTK